MSGKTVLRETVIQIGEQEVTIRPLSLRQLRRFVKVVKLLDGATDDLSDEDIDNMIEAASIALEKAAPELSADKDALQDVIDIQTFNLILQAAMGVDPEE